jgi:hypothetical protein
MGDIPLPTELQHLRNMIDKAESDVSITVLRKVIKSAADNAPATDVIRIAKLILQCGIDVERGKWARRN